MPRLGPDAARYMYAGAGVPVPRPFHLRWMLPWFCGQDLKTWRIVWTISWPLLATGMFAWRLAAGDDWRIATAAVVLLLALPGILGPTVSIPVQVDLPSTAVTVCGLALFELGHPAQQAAAVVLFVVAATMRESAPVWAALALWSPWPLLALAAPLIAHRLRAPGPDPISPKLQDIADHPFRTALEHHAGRWRDGWLMVAPWGACLGALYQPSVQVVVVVAVAYLQLLAATDTVRLLHHAAGPFLAATAAATIPIEWLPLVVALHVVWFRQPERI